MAPPASSPPRAPAWEARDRWTSCYCHLRQISGIFRISRIVRFFGFQLIAGSKTNRLSVGEGGVFEPPLPTRRALSVLLFIYKGFVPL